jgi:hypothetical protein
MGALNPPQEINMDKEVVQGMVGMVVAPGEVTTNP